MTTNNWNEFLQEIQREDGDLWQVLREDLRWDRERYDRFCDTLEKALRGSSVHDVVPRAIVCIPDTIDSIVGMMSRPDFLDHDCGLSKCELTECLQNLRRLRYLLVNGVDQP